MLSGTAPCADIEQTKLRDALDQMGIANDLSGLKQQEFVPVLSKIVPKVKTADTGASDDDIVNGLTTLFCKVGRENDQYRQLGWPQTIGSFASIAYSQVKHPEKQASAAPGATPAITTPPVKN